MLFFACLQSIRYKCAAYHPKLPKVYSLCAHRGPQITIAGHHARQGPWPVAPVTHNYWWTWAGASSSSHTHGHVGCRRAAHTSTRTRSCAAYKRSSKVVSSLRSLASCVAADTSYIWLDSGRLSVLVRKGEGNSRSPLLHVVFEKYWLPAARPSSLSGKSWLWTHYIYLYLWLPPKILSYWGPWRNCIWRTSFCTA